MKRQIYTQECCIVLPSGEDDTFYMNMRVYKIVRAERLAPTSTCDLQLIWCAVYQPKPQGQISQTGENTTAGQVN
jgi:hypothetical protein